MEYRHNNPNIDSFNRDVITNSGYLYTTNARLSSRLANQRLTKATLAVADFRGKRVLDIGCGDGTYTVELFERGYPVSICGIDPAEEAIQLAKQKIGDRRIIFETQSAYQLPYEGNSFDIAYLRGVLHHMDRPIEAIREAMRVAPTIVVVEPNGYNPILKLLERYSRYHIEHDEKSYLPLQLNHWVENVGGHVENWLYAGLVPMFCPDWFARSIKLVEPLVERLPLVSTFGCAVYVFSATRA